MRSIKYIACLALMSVSFLGQAQQEKVKKDSTKTDQKEEISKEMKKSIDVVRDFDPIINEAFKLNELPKILDTIRITPEFKYFLGKYPMRTGFAVAPIAPAKMVGEPLRKLYNAQFKLGVGYPTLPLFEAYYNNLRHEDFSYGANFRHFSGRGKLKINSGESEKAPYSHTNFQLNAKKIFKDAIWNSDAFFKHRSTRYFGADSVANLDDYKVDQSWYVTGINSNFKSTHLDSTHVNYYFNGHLSTAKDEFTYAENRLRIGGGFDKFWDGERMGVDIDIDYFGKSSNLDSANNVVVKFSPWISKYGDKWRVLAGVNITSDNRGEKANTYFFPRGELQFDIVSHYIIPYVNIGGYIEKNNYVKILDENPFIKQGTSLQNTIHKMVLQGGLKGNMSKNISYNLNASFNLVDSLYLYRNDYSERLGNTFNVVYDNAEYTHLSGELIMKASDKLKIHARAETHSYKMNTEEKAWHRPGWESSLAIEYNLRNKILVKADLFTKGDIYAPKFNRALNLYDSSEKLGNIIDANLMVEYRYTKLLSGFLQLNNITASKNFQYANYPSYGFSFLLGVTYVL